MATTESNPAQADLLPPEENGGSKGKKASKKTAAKPEGKTEALTVQQPAPAPQPISQQSAMLLMIERAAKDPAVDIDKMERLMRMQKDMIEDERKRLYFEDLAKAQSEMPQVVKNADNKQTNSRYAKLEKINEAITPVITRHGFTLSFGTAACPIERHHRITCEVGHREGHTKQYEADLPTDDSGIQGTRNKTPLHAFSSSLTYGRRILTCLIFNVAVKDEDDDGNAAGGANPKNAQPAADGIKKTQARPAAPPDHAKHWTDLMPEDVWKFVVMGPNHPFAGEPIWQIHKEKESFERAFKETPREDTIDRHALDAAYASSIYRAFAKKRYVISEVEEALQKTTFLPENGTLRDVPGSMLQELATAVLELPKRQ